MSVSVDPQEITGLGPSPGVRCPVTRAGLELSTDNLLHDVTHACYEGGNRLTDRKEADTVGL